MRQFKFVLYAAMAIATLALTSCKKDPGTEPEPEPDPVVVADIFFSAENGDYCFYAGENDTKTASLKIVRSKSEIADKYAIKVNDATQGLDIPETVEFAAGEKEATITIKAPSTGKGGDKYDFDLSLTGDNVNASASSEEGTIRCEGTIYVYEEVTAVGYFGDEGYDLLGCFPQTVWRMADNKMIFKNFLNSGNDLSFVYAKDHSYDNGTDLGQSIDVLEYSADYEPYVSDSDYDEGSTYYYFYDAQNKKYEWFYPKGEQRFIYGLGFYLGNNYCAYVKNDTYDYVYFYTFQLDIYGEEENVDSNLSWQNLWFNFVDPEGYDFETFPELPEFPDYPKPASVTPKAGNIPLSCYMFEGEYDYDAEEYISEEYIDLDEQEGTVSTDADGNPVLTITNFLNSGETVTITQTSEDGDLDLSFEGGAINSGYYGVYKYYQPWSADDSWSIGYFSFWPGSCSGYISDSYVFISLGTWYYLYYGEKAAKSGVWGELSLYYDASAE